MRKRSHVTLDHIAKRLDVSRVTVSKALRGHSDISAETTEKVRKIAMELGYTPNLFARSLSSRRSHMIGLVVPKIAHAFFGSVIEGVYDAAFERKYETILTVSQENAERELKHLQTLVSMKVDGIIISISQETRDMKRFKWIKKTGIPLVFLDRRPEPAISGFSSVVSGDDAGAFAAAEQAIKIGYRRLGFIGGNTEINIGRDRLNGFRRALEEYGIPVRKEWIVTSGGFGKEDGIEGLKQLAQRNQLPEFVLTATYPVALGVYSAAKSMGLKIPDDIDIICFGDSDVGGFLSPAISCVRQPTEKLGRCAVEVLLESIADPNVIREHHVTIDTDLVLRETCTVKRATGQLRQMPADQDVATKQPE